MKYQIALLFTAAFLSCEPVAAQIADSTPRAEESWPEAWFETFKLAPGKQEEFIRMIAKGDEVLAAAGLPPTQLFFHENGTDFDVILFKPVTPDPTPEQVSAMKRKSEELGLPSGPAYFVDIRRLVAEHHDSKAQGPVSAAAWLARLDQSRENAARR